MGSLVQTKTITKLCNPVLHFSDWKSMRLCQNFLLKMAPRTQELQCLHIMETLFDLPGALPGTCIAWYMHLQIFQPELAKIRIESNYLNEYSLHWVLRLWV